MPNVFQRLWDSMGFNDRFPDDADYDYDYDETYDQESYAAAELPVPVSAAGVTAQGPSNVVGLPGRTNGRVEMIVMEPRTFEEIPQAVAALRERKTVILNLGLMDPDTAQRSVDFVAGGSFAIDGHQERLGENIFLFTPSFIQINNYPGAAPESVPMQPAQPLQRPPVPMPVRPTTTTPPPGWENPPSRRA